MPKRRLVFAVLFSLCCPFFFSQKAGDDDGNILSLKEIDILISTTAYNEALKELTKYISAYPNDFDRAQQRISRIMKLREEYNKGADYLVDLIKNGSETKAEKLTKITELESSELDVTDTVFEFTNLARRTVTLGEVLLQYNRIMREGVALVKAEKYAEAAVKFEEGFAIKNEYSDMIFDTEDEKNGAEGTLVVYEKDITEPARHAVANVRSLVAGSLSSSGMDARISECEKAYAEYMRALSLNNLDAVRLAFSHVSRAFSDFADLRNKIVQEVKSLSEADMLANERNPLLLGTSYITFHQKFILGDESNPDTGIIGSFNAYYNRRVEAMKAGTNKVIFSVLDGIINKLPEQKLYSLVNRIASEQKNVAVSKEYADSALALHGLYNLLKNLDGSSVGEMHTGYAESMGFVDEYIADLALAYDSVRDLAREKANPEKLDKSNLSDGVLSHNVEKVLRYEQIKSDSKSYISLIESEQEKEKKYFDEKAEREREIAELVELSGGRLSVASFQKRNTAGVQISDDPLDFRKQISYFSAVNAQNLQEASVHAQRLWGFVAYAYATLGERSYDSFEKKCSETEILLSGEKTAASQDDEFSVQLVKKFPIEAKAQAETLVEDIKAKKGELVSWRETLSLGEEYRSVEGDFDSGTRRLDSVIALFDSLGVRTNEIARAATPEIRRYEETLREAYEQYERALAAFKREDFDNANVAVDSASTNFALALDIEYSEKIRAMREETLSSLAVQIQQAEYEKVLREVFALKDRATTYYYSSNFDAAENLLVTAQTRWAKVSTEPDEEIEELLNVVKVIKSISYGRVLVQSDPHYPELSYSLDMAKQSFEKGVQFKKSGNAEKARESFNLALTNIRNVQNIYPLNKEARLITLKIQQELDPEGFPRQFENQYNAAKMNANKNERLADLEDLYEINPKYPGLAQEIYNLKDSLGMFPKKEVKKEVKRSADSKIAEARRAFRAAGNDETKLNASLAIINEAIAIDPTSKEAKELKLDIQLKIGATSTAILSQNDEKMYAEAARLFNQRKFAEAKSLMDRLLLGAAAQKSRKVIDLNNRLLKRL